MKNIIKLGLLSTLLSATLLAETEIVTTDVKLVSKTKIDVKLQIRDDEPTSDHFNFKNLSVDSGANIKGMKVNRHDDYSTHYTFRIEGNNCNESNNTEVKGVFSSTINDKDLALHYTRCKEVPGVVETDYPYRNNTNQEMILSGSYGYAIDWDFGYFVRIHGETERNYDFISLVDQSGNVLTGKVMNPGNFEFTEKPLKFSGNFSEKNIRDNAATDFFRQDAIYIFLTPEQVPDDGLKVIFTSDGSITKEGARIDMTRAFPM